MSEVFNHVSGEAGVGVAGGGKDAHPDNGDAGESNDELRKFVDAGGQELCGKNFIHLGAGKGESGTSGEVVPCGNHEVTEAHGGADDDRRDERFNDFLLDVSPAAGPLFHLWDHVNEHRNGRERQGDPEHHNTSEQYHSQSHV